MLLIYLTSVTSRSEYIFELIFKNELGIDYRVTTNVTDFEDHKQEKINYSQQKTGDEIFIHASTLLFEHSIEEKNIPVGKKSGTTVLFPNVNSCDAGFDIFAATFYMVSRYEEYLPFTPDKHGRFKATSSLAHRNNFLKKPVVNIWIKQLRELLSKKFPSIKFRQQNFNAILTYDIDIAYEYKGKSITRNAGGVALDIISFNFKKLQSRLRHLVSGKDSWDVYDNLAATLKDARLKTIFFFLMGDYSRYDKNIKFDHPLMKHLVAKVSAFSDVGIHPSYKTPEIPEKILIEKERLEKFSGKPVTKSRQHYLRFKLPDTFNDLIQAGITEDFSMGFADMPGFRAGICTPFYFYDLKNERATSLQLFPVTIMEGSYIYYMKWEPAESQKMIFELIDNVKKVDGTFISIWHNNTVSNDEKFKEWKMVHDEMIKKIAALTKT